MIFIDVNTSRETHHKPFLNISTLIINKFLNCRRGIKESLTFVTLKNIYQTIVKYYLKVFLTAPFGSKKNYVKHQLGYNSMGEGKP